MRRDLNYWLDLLYRRRRIALRAGIPVLALVILGTIMWPPVYESTCEILVQDNRAQLLVSPGLQENAERNPAVVANPISEEDLNSEREVLTSLYLVRLAITELKVPAGYNGPGAVVLGTLKAAMHLPAAGYRVLHETPALTPRDAWALDIARHLQSSVIKKSDVIEVEFRAHDPSWSKRFLERLISQYMEYHAGVTHDPEAQQFFLQQAKLLQDKLNVSEENLRAYQVQTKIGNLDEQKQALIDRTSDLETELSKATAQLAGAEQQAVTLRQQLASTPQRISKETRSVQNLALQQLKPQVMQLRAERAELLTRYLPTSERIKEIDAKLEAAQRILSNENHLEVSESSTDINPVWVTVDSNYQQAQTSVAALRASQVSLNRQLGNAHQELTDLVNNGVKMERLQRQVEADKEAYLAYVRKSEEARASEALNRNKILNVSLAQPPSQPLQPVFPIIWLNLLAGFALAGACALGSAYLEETYDPKIYSATAIEEASGLATVAIVTDRI